MQLLRNTEIRHTEIGDAEIAAIGNTEDTANRAASLTSRTTASEGSTDDLGTIGLVDRACSGFDEINSKLSVALANRLNGSDTYSQQEINDVTKLDRKLFPKNFELDPTTYEHVTRLCRFAHSGPPKLYEIRSHRKILGPFIVAAKRLVWKFMQAQLKDSSAGFREFSSWMVYSHVAQLVEIRELKQQLDRPS